MASSRNEKGGIAHSWVIVNDDSTTENFDDSTTTTEMSEQTLKEFFVQYYFQCVLSANVSELKEQFDRLIVACCNYNNDQFTTHVDYTQYIIKMCLQNRDIKHGKGLAHTTHMMLNTIAYYSYEEDMMPRNTLLKILKSFVIDRYNEETTLFEHPYGSWKDIKYFLDYFWVNNDYEYINVPKYDIISEIIQQLYIPQMIVDRKKMSIYQPISLCGKWLPRESGQFAWLAKNIARQYHHEVYRVSEKNTKIYQKYRKLIAECNTYLDTTQVHMAGNQWDRINFDYVTSKTLFLNKSAFLNSKNNDQEHRRVCKQNFQQFIANKENTGNYLKNNNTVMPHILVRDALRGLNQQNESMSVLNMQWNGLMKTLENNEFMKYCYPCIDVSPSMMRDNSVPLHCAIGLGLACAHLSDLHRAFTFSSHPDWIQYDQDESFVDRVYKTRNSNWGSTTNIHRLFKKILDTCLTKNENNQTIPQSEIDKMCLIIFSDMQFDCREEQTCPENAEAYEEEELFDVIRREYKDAAGYDNIPFLIFWNLRTTNTFPSIEKSKNMIKLSGNSVCLLEIFMKIRLEDFKKLENWDILKQILDHKRYILS
uniref:TROVE domain-containing protein n=1 Tax=viral metagenome TaxID=1070528 RepID=A0A6C0KZM6_9ZZZZ